MKRRWLQRFLVLVAALVLVTLGAGFYAYLNLRDVVVWFANRGHPRLVLDLRRAVLQQSELNRNKAFNGEWIEVPQSDGTFVWKQKGM